MINKIRFRFVIISTLCLAIVFALLIGGINLVRYGQMLDTVDSRLETIASADTGIICGTWYDQVTREGMQKIVVSSYFSVIIDQTGDIHIADIGKLYPLDPAKVKGYVSDILLSSKSGFADDYRYLAVKSDKGTKIVFYDCSEALSEFRTWRNTSIMIADSALLLAFVVLDLMSEFIVKPVSESYEKHKSFITNASHEIKTPLAIINADTALLEESLGEESEWAEDIRKQIKNLTDLTNDLVLLSKIVEKHNKIERQETDLTELIREAASSFRAQAVAEDKRYDFDLEEDIKINTDKSMVRQIMSILLDNAMKYSERQVEVSLRRTEKTAEITVTNDTSTEVTEEDLLHMFDRFYRSDMSRSSGKSGHGLGLSIAKAACDNIGGKISARKEGEDFLTLAVSIPCR